MVQIDPDLLSRKQRYKLLSGCIVPRPIAFVSTQSSNGLLNAAPFSYFNMVSGTPPMICLGIGSRPDGTPKDTARNIIETGEFVVNLVDEPLLEKMNLAATDAPQNVSEFDITGLQPTTSVKVAAPRIMESPVSLECTLYHSLPLKDTGSMLFVGEIVWLHLRDDIVFDDYKVDVEKLQPVGRLAGSEYSLVRDRLAIDRISYQDFLRRS